MIKTKRVVCSIAATLLMMQWAFTASAATPSYSAVYSTPTIDGTVNTAEYGAAQKLDKSTSSIFFAHLDMTDPNVLNTVNFPDITYRFAWDEGHLFVGITAKNIEALETSKFQIDLSPEKKVKDKQKGVFFTFQVLNLGSGLLSISRDNYQTDGSTKLSVNITNKVDKSVKQVGDTVHMEIAIPLAELQVAGQGRDFSSLTLKAGDWGVGTYFIGNGVGLTTTQGANNSALVSTNVDSGILIEYFNPLTLQAKAAATTSGNSTTKATVSGITTSGNKSNSSTTVSGGSHSTVSSESALTSNEGTNSGIGEESFGSASLASQAANESKLDSSAVEALESDSSAGEGQNAAGLIIGFVIGGIVLAGGIIFIILKMKKKI